MFMLPRFTFARRFTTGVEHQRTSWWAFIRSGHFGYWVQED